MKQFFIFLVLLFALSACADKKERLTSNSLSIVIDPPTFKAYNGMSRQLKAIYRSPGSKDLDISAAWTVDPPTIGDIALPNSGKTALFVASNVEATGKVYAEYEGARGEIPIEVLKEPYPLYADSGVSKYLTKDAQGNVIFYYFDTDNAAPWQIAISNSSPGSAGDTLSCMKIDYTNSPGGWGGFYMEFSPYKDMSIFSKLSFYVRGENGGEKFLIKVADGFLPDKEYQVSNVTTSWQEMVIPFSSLPGLVPITITKPFVIAFTDDYTGGNATVYLDYITYKK